MVECQCNEGASLITSDDVFLFLDYDVILFITLEYKRQITEDTNHFMELHCTDHSSHNANYLPKTMSHLWNENQ